MRLQTGMVTSILLGAHTWSWIGGIGLPLLYFLASLQVDLHLHVNPMLRKARKYDLIGATWHDYDTACRHLSAGATIFTCIAVGLWHIGSDVNTKTTWVQFAVICIVPTLIAGKPDVGMHRKSDNGSSS